MGLTRIRADQISNIDYKQAVRVITVANVTLSGGAPNSVDGVNLAAGDRVLVQGQSTGSQNGIYVVATLGTGSNGTWSRSTDGNETGEIEAGMIIMVTEGDVYKDTQWKLTTNNPIIIGTTALTFEQNTGVPVAIANGTSNVSVVSSGGNVTVGVGGTSNIAVFSTAGIDVTGNLLPTANITYDLGSNDRRWQDLWLSNSTIYLGNAQISANATAITFTNPAGGTTVLSGATPEVAASTISATGNITGGNIRTGGLISAAGTVTGSTFIGNGSGLSALAGANVTGTVANATYATSAGSATTAGTVTTAAQDNITSVGTLTSLSVSGNVQGGNLRTAGLISATGTVYGVELTSTQSSGSEGGQINLAQPASGSTLGGGITIDAYNNLLRIFEQGGTARGAYIDLTSCNAAVGTNLLAGGGGGTPGGSNTYVQFNDGGTFGGNSQFTYDKVTNSLTVGNVFTTSNGAGTNLRVGDDAWIGDVNQTNTIQITGQQNGTDGYIIFGNSNTNKLGRSGTGPLTYDAAFSATGNVAGGNILTGGIISATGNISGGNVAAATALFSLGTVGASGNTSGGNLTTTGQVSATGNITGGNILTGGLISAAGTITGSSLAGTLTTAAQTNITSVGTLSSLSVSGNVQGGNLRTAGLISATGTITGSSLAGTLTTAAQTNITSVGTLTSLSVSGNIASGNLSATGIAGTLSTAAQTNITSVGTLSSLSVSGNVQGGNLRTAGLISATGTVTGTTFIGIANQAKYADLAEYYIADVEYPVGTVLEFGGTNEVTQSTSNHATSIAGTVSDKPAYIMNSGLDHPFRTPVALMGRVPCKVVGTIRKGDRLVASDIPGMATALNPAFYQPGCIIGKALENYDSPEPGIIEVVVGRL